MKRSISLLVVIGLGSAAAAQEKQDTLQYRPIDSVVVMSFMRQNNITPLPATQGTFLFGGKKSEVISLLQIPADITNKTGRQVFAKVPGVFVYDMDGAGNQVNIAARGLDPHRGWEFNIRKDGVVTNSDMYGYPASHYSMPLESIERIELVRGTGSLQYGAQFGGMLNYVSKQGDSTRRFSFENISSVGSYNLLSTYNAVGGKVGKFRYYGYIYRKSRDGYRDNEHTDSEAEGLSVVYEPNSRFNVKIDWARSKYKYRIPGALNDSMFAANPRQATRSRNFFSPDIHVPSITLNWKVAGQTKISLVTSAVLGRRNSVMWDKPTNVMDTINASTLNYNNRQVDIDRFNSYTTELRVAQDYRLGKQTSTLVTGVQYMNNDLHRTQQGKGTIGTEYDLSLVDPVWGRDVHLKTSNIALFAENSFRLTDKLSVNAGARVEVGETKMSGTIVYYPTDQIPVSMEHNFPLLGVSFSYKPKDGLELYGGYSQAYHPMLFKDLIPTSTFERVDPDISDAKGYNAEIGTRGSFRSIRWDITGFLLGYDNRFGTLSGIDASNQFYTYRTNIGNSLTKGLEVFVQGDWLLGKKAGISVFTSTAFTEARYTDASVKSGNANIDIRGNRVESSPSLITRNGVSLRYRKFVIGALYSYTARTYADALNTIVPPAATGATGMVPSYGLLDLNASFRFTSSLEVRLNVGNVTDMDYFTKRPTFYPGPGIWPSDGRNGTMTLVVRL
ncbi:MAG: TonB-dependent receptor [Chitinophagaceae bacterium]|nr:MAG: TonB-dependent receptor [Chitinophagaceae bacterium]